jgi:hypothetical protein
MTRLQRALIAGTAIFAGAMAGPAPAAVTHITYTGIVEYGWDFTGEFGAPNASLYGDPFTAEYTFNDRLGTRILGSDYTANYGEDEDSPGKVSMTINGRQVWISTPTWSIQSRDHEPGFDQISHDVEDKRFDTVGPDLGDYHDSHLSLFASSDVTGFNIAADYAAPQSYVFTDDDMPGGDLQFLTVLKQLSTGQESDQHYARAELLPSSFTIFTSVPEPREWTLLICGLGGLGLMLRTRRRGMRGA